MLVYDLAEELTLESREARDLRSSASLSLKDRSCTKLENDMLNAEVDEWKSLDLSNMWQYDVLSTLRRELSEGLARCCTRLSGTTKDQSSRNK